MYYRIDWHETGEITECNTREAADEFIAWMLEDGPSEYTLSEQHGPSPFDDLPDDEQAGEYYYCEHGRGMNEPCDPCENLFI